MREDNETTSSEGDGIQAFLSKLPFPYHSLDASCRILEVNQAWLQSLGYTKKEVVGKQLTRFMDEDARPDFEENFRTFIQNSGKFSGQMELVSKSGKPVQFLVDGMLEKSDTADVTRTRCFLRDISRHCKAEMKLQRLSMRNAAILGAVPEILMEIDSDRVYIWANTAGFDFFGPKALGSKIDDFSIDFPLEKIDKLLHGETETFEIQSWQRRADGELRLLAWRFKTLSDESGGVSGALASARDITDKHLQNERIIRLNSILKGIRGINQLITQETSIERLLDGACDNLVGPFGFVSAWTVLFDNDERTVRAASLSGLGSNDLEKFKRRMIDGELTDCAKMCVKSRDFVVIDEREQCSNCVLREFHWSGDALVNGTLVLPLIVRNKLAGIFAASIPLSEVNDPEITSLFREVVRDITLAMEKTLNEKELERLRLEKAKSAKLESLGVMAGGIAHDFNNVLVGILGNVSLAKLELKKDVHLREYLDSTENAARKARELTQRLLTFSKGGTPIKSPTSIVKIINESSKFLFPDSTIKIEIETPNDLPLALGEPSQIQQALNNLLLNAKDALKETENPMIEIRCEKIATKSPPAPSLPPGEYVKVTISDNGPGVPEKIADKIFDPYFTTKPGGSGLGLSSVFSILKAHNGAVLLEPSPKGGASFALLIPAAAASSASEAPRPLEVALKRSDHAGNAKILIMDDESLVRGILTEYITKFGWESEKTETGEAAVEEYKKAFEAGAPYDLVILDLMVPDGMGGLEAAKRILEIDSNAKLIVSSGYSEDDAIANFAEHGFAAALRKPYAVEELFETISALLA